MRTRTAGPRNLRRQSSTERNALTEHYRRVRRMSEVLAHPLKPDDYGLQAMAEVSPAKWHLAHTSWFFETFLLAPFLPHYRAFHPQFGDLFNSYYNEVGAPFPRPRRALLSRPTTEEVYRYRAHIDAAIISLLTTVEEDHWREVESRTTLGCHHEEQHQELFLTDILYNFSHNPVRPAYRDDLGRATTSRAAPLSWLERPEAETEIGHHGSGFAFDNESPRHRVRLAAHAVASRLVTNGEYLEFIEAQGYARAKYWLSDGWQAAQERQWFAPLYWEKHDQQWWTFTLGGMRPVNANEPVCHVSYYEADAYARWTGKRLLTEAEWEALAQTQPADGNLRDEGHLHPIPAPSGAPLAQLYGDVWEWTASNYSAYPGYRPAPGALGEYNGKFMINQMVLRGGSCVTPAAHMRATYRNFFYPGDRWQFSGIRLAEDR